MNITFELKDKSLAVSPIRMVVTHRGKRYRKALGISISTKEWRPKNKTNPCANVEVAQKLKEYRTRLESMVNDTSTSQMVERAIFSLFQPHMGGQPSENPSYWEYWEIYAQKEVSAQRQRRLAMNVVRRLMGDGDRWEDVDESYYYRLREKMNREGYSVNYQGSILTKLRTVMSEGYKLKYHKNDEYKRFDKVSEETDKVYLTKQELERLESLELKDDMERRVRDLFLIGVYTAARFEDYSRLTLLNEKDGLLQFIQLKTHDPVILPLSPKVHEVLVRNGGKAPQMHINTFNKEIKGVCMKAKINDLVTIRVSKGEKHYTETKRKYLLVSSHTARRTGATLLYTSGIPIAQCMMITGHRSESSFRRYIQLTKEENAKMLASNPFFK